MHSPQSACLALPWLHGMNRVIWLMDLLAASIPALLLWVGGVWCSQFWTSTSNLASSDADFSSGPLADELWHRWLLPSSPLSCACADPESILPLVVLKLPVEVFCRCRLRYYHSHCSNPMKPQSAMFLSTLILSGLCKLIPFSSPALFFPAQAFPVSLQLIRNYHGEPRWRVALLRGAPTSAAVNKPVLIL